MTRVQRQRSGWARAAAHHLLRRVPAWFCWRRGFVVGDVGFSAIIVRVMRYSNLVRSTNLLGGGRLLVSLQTQAGQGSRAAGHPRPKGAAGFVIAGGNVTLEDLRAASKPFVPSDRPINSSDRSDAAILLDALLVRVARISRPANWRTPRCPFQR